VDNPETIAAASEGRGLAVLIGYSLKGCSSACTVTSIGGKKRLLGPNAKLGFHRYRPDSKSVLPFLDSDNELKKRSRFLCESAPGAIHGVVIRDKLAPPALSPTASQDAYR